MDSNSALAPTELDKNILDKLDSYEDFLSYYLQLEEGTVYFAWQKADLLNQMTKKLGDKSIKEVSKDLKQPFSTVQNYVRAARAFPTYKRNPTVSFTHHFQASFSDSYLGETGKFVGENRFKWVETVADKPMSVNRLKDLMTEHREKKQLKTKYLPCKRCDTKERTTLLYLLYTPGVQRKPHRFYMCEPCRNDVLEFLKIT